MGSQSIYILARSADTQKIIGQGKEIYDEIPENSELVKEVKRKMMFPFGKSKVNLEDTGWQDFFETKGSIESAEINIRDTQNFLEKAGKETSDVLSLLNKGPIDIVIMDNNSKVVQIFYTNCLLKWKDYKAVNGIMYFSRLDFYAMERVE